MPIGHGGNGTAMHLTSALFNRRPGCGSARRPSWHRTATVDVLAGHIHGVLDIGITAIDPRWKVEGAGRVCRKPVVFLLAFLGARSGPGAIESVGWLASSHPPLLRLISQRLNAAQKALKVPRRSKIRLRPSQAVFAKLRAVHPERKRQMVSLSPTPYQANEPAAAPGSAGSTSNLPDDL
jgi:hypothetical protein